MWNYVPRTTGGFYRHSGFPNVTVHVMIQHPERTSCTHRKFFMLEMKGVTQLDARDMRSALTEADSLMRLSRDYTS